MSEPQRYKVTAVRIERLIEERESSGRNSL